MYSLSVLELAAIYQNRSDACHFMTTSTKLALVSLEDPCARIILEVNLIWHCHCDDLVVYEVYGAYNLIGSCLFITIMFSPPTMCYRGRGIFKFGYVCFPEILHFGPLIIIIHNAESCS